MQIIISLIVINGKFKNNIYSLLFIYISDKEI